MNGINAASIREIQRLYTNSVRTAPSGQQGTSVSTQIETIIRKHKFKEHALSSVLGALGLQRYTAADAMRCFDMERDVVSEYLIEKRWNPTAARIFVDYVWFDRLVL